MHTKVFVDANQRKFLARLLVDSRKSLSEFQIFNRERNTDNEEFRLESAEFRAATLWEKNLPDV